MQDNDWEMDINLGPESMHNIFRKRDILAYEPDKDLALACERYQHPQNYFNDDLSSIASSVVSSRFSELSLHHNIDDFMFDPPAPPPQNEIVIEQQQNLPGVVKKLGLCFQNAIQENDDWDDDIQLPTKGMSLGSSRRRYEQQIDFDIDIGPSVSERVARSSTAPKFKYDIEQDDDQDDMTGLDFPVNMATLPKRLHEKKTMVNPPPPSSNKRTVYKSKIPTSPKSKLLASMRERDDDDFTEGLNVKEKNFHTDLSTLSQRQQPSSSKGKSPASRLARPTLVPKSRIPELPRRQAPIHQQPSVPQQVPARRNILTGKQASLNRGADTPAARQRPIINRTLTSREPIERKSATGCRLISRPKTTNTGGYCSQLDNMDNLNDLRPKFSRQVNNNDRNGADTQRPWRRNMQQQQPQQKANVRLIKPNEQPIKNKYNDMEFDSVAHIWNGNEKSLLGFQEKLYRRPMLMTQRQQKPSRYAAVIGNGMIFNNDEQKWVSALGPQQEFNELDAIDDLVEGTPMQRRRFGEEFKLSVETKREMMMVQEMHERFIQNWPLTKGDPHILQCHHDLGASKYPLYD